MSKLLEKAFSRVRALPQARQDEVARIVMQLVGVGGERYTLNADERRDLKEADAEIVRGELASDEEVAALWSKTIPGS